MASPALMLVLLSRRLIELEAGIAETVAEGIERLACDVPVARREVGAVFGLVGEVVVVVERLLACGVCPADGKFATRVHIAEENVSDRVATFGAGIPGFEDRRNVARGPADVERTAILKYEDNRLACRCNGLEHLLLDAGQIHGGARGRFAAHDGGLTHNGDHDVCVGGSGLGFSDRTRRSQLRWAEEAAWFRRSCRTERERLALGSARQRS